MLFPYFYDKKVRSKHSILTALYIEIILIDLKSLMNATKATV